MEFSFLNLKYVLLWFLLNTTNVDPISYVVLFSLVLIYIFSMIFIRKFVIIYKNKFLTKKY